MLSIDYLSKANGVLALNGIGRICKMSKGTILYVGGFELPDKNAAAHRVLSNGKIFRELGYNVAFIDVDKSLKFNSNILETKKNIQGFECLSLPYPNSIIEWLKYLSSIDDIKMICNQYDDVKVIIAYNYQAVALNRLKYYCRNQDIRIVADCTEWYSTKGANIAFKVIKGLDSFLRMRIIQKRLDGLIVISKYLENYYEQCNNVVRIPPLVDLTEEKWEKVTDELTNNKVRFVYSGSPGKNKDKINRLIEALYELKGYDNYVFNVVGITKAQYVQDYPEHKKLLSVLGERIKFLGTISHVASLQEMNNSDFSIFIREETRLTKAGFPTKFVESISCKTPVITNKNSNITDFLIDGENGFLIDSTDIKVISSALRRVLLIDKNVLVEMKLMFKEKDMFHFLKFINILKIFFHDLERGRK